MDKKTEIEMRLYDPQGARLYLTHSERLAFLREAEKHPRQVRTLCMTLCLTGCRISEALNLVVASVDIEDKTIVFETLKQRRGDVFRAVPVPDSLLEALAMTHDLRMLQRKPARMKDLLWDISRKTAYSHIKGVMKAAGIIGKHATPKGLRHAFGVHAVSCGVPLNMLQKWLGHAQLSTTAIYADAQGQEARDIASRMW